MTQELVRQKNPIAFQMIKNATESNRTAHAFLFAAPHNYKISDEWEFLVQSLISSKTTSDKMRNIRNYPDLIVVDGLDRIIKKEEITTNIYKLKETPLEASGIKILVILSLENANKQAINSFLKFLEDPTSNTYIIMTTNKIASILPTIKSRSQIIPLKALSFQKLKENIPFTKHQNLLARLIFSLEDVKKIQWHLDEYLDKIIIFLKAIVVKPNHLHTLFNLLVNKKNAKFILRVINVFFNDIWRLEQNFELSFSKMLIEKYQQANFNFILAIKAINDFFYGLEKNGNFELCKSKVSIELIKCFNF